MRNGERERQQKVKMRPQNRAPNLASKNGPKFTASIETAFSWALLSLKTGSAFRAHFRPRFGPYFCFLKVWFCVSALLFWFVRADTSTRTMQLETRFSFPTLCSLSALKIQSIARFVPWSGLCVELRLWHFLADTQASKAKPPVVSKTLQPLPAASGSHVRQGASCVSKGFQDRRRRRRNTHCTILSFDICCGPVFGKPSHCLWARAVFFWGVRHIHCHDIFHGSDEIHVLGSGVPVNVVVFQPLLDTAAFSWCFAVVQKRLPALPFA